MASTWPESMAWMVALMSSNQTMRVPGGATLGTVDSSSVARVMPMRLPAMSSALAMAVFLGPKTTMARAPLGLQKATVLARSKVMEMDDRVRSQRPASNEGMRWVETTCCRSSSTPRSLASWRQLADFDAVGACRRCR